MKNIMILFYILSAPVLFAQASVALESEMVDKQSIDSEYMNLKVQFYVYLPDAYKLNTTDSFPVIYWLHGSGGYPPGMIKDLATRFHGAIQDKKMPPAIVVFLDDGMGHSMWVDWKDGSVKMESIVINEVIPHIDRSYRTIANGRGRLLEGGSMGGYGAGRFGFKRPDMFAAISMINPGPVQEILIPEEAPLAGAERAQKTLDSVYGGDINYFRELSPWQIAKSNAERIKGNLDIRIILGGADPSGKNILKLSEHLQQLGIEHNVMIVENAGHSPKAMFNALDNSYWDFFDRNLSGLKN